jgi:hypothetical protein
LGLADNVGNFDLGTGATVEVDEPKILLNTIALGNGPRFNEFQSTSLGNDDNVSGLAGTKLKNVLAQMGAASRPHVGPQTEKEILNRAQAGTCAGCHMLSPGEVVRQDPSGTTVNWPPVADGGFVHVREDRVLSGALEESFLPFRRYVLGRHLCPGALPAAAALVVAAETGGPAPANVADARQGSMRFVDTLISGYLAGRQPIQEAAVSAAPAAESPDMVMVAARLLAPPEQDVLRQKVHEAIAEARRLEQQLPGAFVETRRPH